MQHRQQRARCKPGPLVLLALVLMSAGVLAHDPGLSSLEVNITSLRTSAILSMSAADLSLLVSQSGIAAERPLDELARSAVQISVDGDVPPATMTTVELDDKGASVRWSFARGASHEAQVTVSSDVPRRLARGHRELVAVMVDGVSVSERMLDAEHHLLAVDVTASPSTASKASSFMTLGIRHILSGYDHLVFLAGLILAACTVRELVVALTTFTAAHSLSLAMVGALLEIGFRSSATGVALALLAFNIGVEAGQLSAAAVMLPIVWVIRSRTGVAGQADACVLADDRDRGSYWLVARLW